MEQRFYGVDKLDSNSIRNSRPMPLPKGVFFVKPDFFDVAHGINPHMLDKNGTPNKVDRDLAYQQWQALVNVYRELGLETKVFEAKSACPDMVFCANQSFPYLDEQSNPAALLCNMANDQRQEEVESIAQSLREEGIRLQPLPKREPTSLFEGMGDALWVPGRRFVLGGFGFRTHKDIYRYIHEIIDAPITLFDLRQPKFYHLDTCLSILDENSVLACKEAFLEEDWQLISTLFSQVIEVPMEEADSPGFACNAHCPDTKHVILQAGNPVTEEKLKNANFTPIPVETGEFIKSGGSVFCMKQILF